MANKQENIQDIKFCKCGQQFVSSNFPFQFPNCGHNNCELCLEKLKFNKLFQCNVCSQQSTTKGSPNYYIMQIIRGPGRNTYQEGIEYDPQEGQGLCFQHQKPFTKKCLQCNWVCDACSLLCESLCHEFESMQFCERHNTPNSRVCIICHAYVCVICESACEAQNHQIIDSNLALYQYRNQLYQVQKQSVQAKVSATTQLQQDYQRNMENLAKDQKFQLDAFQQQIDNIREFLNCYEKNQLDYFQKRYNQAIESLQNTISQLDFQLKSLKLLDNQVNAAQLHQLLQFHHALNWQQPHLFFEIKPHFNTKVKQQISACMEGAFWLEVVNKAQAYSPVTQEFQHEIQAQNKPLFQNQEQYITTEAIKQYSLNEEQVKHANAIIQIIISFQSHAQLDLQLAIEYSKQYKNKQLAAQFYLEKKKVRLQSSKKYSPYITYKEVEKFQMKEQDINYVIQVIDVVNTLQQKAAPINVDEIIQIAKQINNNIQEVACKYLRIK